MTTGVLFVENYIAGGSDQVARTLLEKLPFSSLTVMVNRGNDTRILLAGGLPPHVTVEYYDLVTIPDMIGFAKRRKNAAVRLFLRVVAHVMRYPLFALSVAYFMSRIARTGASVFIANNGGYPAGSYCRSATIAASMLADVKSFHVIHSMALPARGGFAPFEWLVDRAIDRGSRIVAVCRAGAVHLKRVRWISQDAEVIYNALADRPVPPATPNSQTLRVLHVGYFDRNKNQAMLIRAIAELARRGCADVFVRLVGIDPPAGLMRDCRRLAADLGISDRVRFEGFAENVERHYAEADLFVLCSNWEGFPISILEAMRAGRPVVATDVGGISEQVTEGVTGYLVQPGDHLGLADRIGSLLDRNVRLRFGNAGRAAFEQKFTLDRMIAGYVRVLGLAGDSEVRWRSRQATG